MPSQRPWKLLGAAIVAVALLGVVVGWQQLGTKPTSPTTMTITPYVTTVSGTETAAKPVSTLKLFGQVCFDYNGNGRQDAGEPAVPDVTIALDGANITATNATGRYSISSVTQGSHKLRLFPPTQFRYMCESAAEFRSVKEPYEIQVSNETRKDIGLMEGFLTLSIPRGVPYEVDRFYDRDPDPDKYLWWNGATGYDRNQKRGYSPNHDGIDYYIEEGNPLVSPAPGTVESVNYEDPGGNCVVICHPNGFRTSCGHISRAVVNVGEQVIRGQTIAISGKSGRNTELANYPHNHFRLTYGKTIAIDLYAPKFKMTPQYSGYYDLQGEAHWVNSRIESSPNMENHWTKYNDPQHADVYSASPSDSSSFRTASIHSENRSAILAMSERGSIILPRIRSEFISRSSRSASSLMSQMEQWLLYT